MVNNFKGKVNSSTVIGYRPLYFEEEFERDLLLQSFYENPTALKDFLEPVFNTPYDITVKHQRGEYLDKFYARNKRGANMYSVRRYFQDPKILGFDMFELEKQAGIAKKVETYADFLGYTANTVPNLKIARNILNLAFGLTESYKDVIAMRQEGKWSEWLYTIKLWYANSFLATIWYGKAKEKLVENVIRKELEAYSYLKLAPTSKEKDMKYKIDFVILDRYTNRPVAGISVKGLSWYYANLKGANVYQQEGERREEKGHTMFKKDFKADTYIIVSDPHTSGIIMSITTAARHMLTEVHKRFYSDNT